MGMTPGDFLWAFVEGNYCDFDENRDSVRHGFNAALAAFSLADHVINYYRRTNPSVVANFEKKQDYYAFLTKKCPSFRDVQSVANVYKHLYQPQPISSVSSTGAIEVLSASEMTLGVIWGIESGGQDEVFFRTRDGETKNLMTAIEDVIQMWRTEIMRLSEN